jgi:hypothetical protein
VAKKQQDIGEYLERFIGDYRERYYECVRNAQAAAETTATYAWQATFAREMCDHGDAIMQAVAGIRAACDELERLGVDEEREKEIKQAVKALSDERARHQAWLDRAVRPYRDPFDTAAGILVDVQASAEREEREKGLLCRGLGEAVRDVLALWPRIAWNPKTGVILVSDPEAGEAKATA